MQYYILGVGGYKMRSHGLEDIPQSTTEKPLYFFLNSREFQHVCMYKCYGDLEMLLYVRTDIFVLAFTYVHKE